ncbi:MULTISPECIES: RNA polymerase sigma factor [Flavobacteriaceae]|uniref:RNA polymerase sigma factor n=1 Tax=Flavobacteriaceae TaxID=49546 RepID=UPI001491FE88|nr:MULTISPECIES: RNA polymerase sigma factor [Allomuricauda]MDC6367536.1 RNA polymerase sigma factor [Muricauda sp. AC10]
MKKDRNDIVLIENLKTGDRNAYQSIYLMYYESLFKYVYHLCNNEALTEDLVQDTLMTLWDKRRKLVTGKSLKSYLYTTAKNKFIDHYRKRKNRSELLEQLRMERIVELEYGETSLVEDRLKLLRQNIEKLPPRKKEILLLSKIERLKHKEIAQLLDISERTVEAHIRQAMIYLKKTMAASSIIVLLVLLSWLS